MSVAKDKQNTTPVTCKKISTLQRLAKLNVALPLLFSTTLKDMSLREWVCCELLFRKGLCQMANFGFSLHQTKEAFS